MSIFRPLALSCPACGASFPFDVVDSVNADRRPDLRQAILDGTFQRQDCPKCGKAFRVEPEMTYLDVGRKQWVLLQPAGSLPEWAELERHANSLFATAYGDKASPAAREIGRGLQVRVTFGWLALREKLYVADQGLDDVALELLKMALIRSLGDPPLDDDIELRLFEVDGDDLLLAWFRAAEESPVETARVPRARYDQIAAGEEWKALRDELTAGPFVDVHRLLVEPAETPAA